MIKWGPLQEIPMDKKVEKTKLHKTTVLYTGTVK
jgi:hypothetical protein